MENVKIVLDSGVETSVNGIFYVFNSKYFFIYTTGEIDESGYVKLYIVQVCKEVKNTPNGSVDTGYMLGIEIPDSDEWKKVQESITMIVEDKKNGTQNSYIQYLPMNMLVNLKIVSKNKFKLMKQIVVDNFSVVLDSKTTDNSQVYNNNLESDNKIETGAINPIIENNIMADTDLSNNNGQDDVLNDQYSRGVENTNHVEVEDEVIIDYRTRFFEEQQKNQELQEEIRVLNEKLNGIKEIIG